MAKSGFMPAWMKIQNSDKLNGTQKQNFDRSNSNIRPSQTLNRSETSSTSSSPSIITGQCRNKSNEQQLSNDFDRQSESFFSFSSSHTQAQRSYSRERIINSFAKNSEFNNNESFNGHRPINNSQRRLHSISTYPNHRQQLSTISHHHTTNGNFSDRLNDEREQNSDMTIKTNDNEQINHSAGFDRDEQNFPSLNGHEKTNSLLNNPSSSIWKNAASKLRTSHNESFKLLDRSLANNSNLFGPNRKLARKDRLSSTPNGLNGTSSLTTTPTNRTITLELPTNCITQTKNLDKRSDFFNSLKNDSTNERNKIGHKRQYNNESMKIIPHSDKNHKTSKGTLLLLSVPETPEEKELLIRMGWKDGDEVTYEITDQDKEEYEKRIKHSPKTDNTSTTLMSALNRRALPCINIGDFLRFEMFNSPSDDDSSDE